MLNMGVTPVLEVAEPYIDGSPTISLRDESGQNPKRCLVPFCREVARTLNAGDRIIVEEYKILYRRSRVVMLKKFRRFDEHSLPLSAVSYLPNPIAHDTLTEKGVSTDSLLTIFPESSPATCAHRKLCTQVKFNSGVD